MARRKRRTRATWQKLVDEYASSGVTPAAFAARRGLHAETLRHWIRELRSTTRRQAGRGGPRVREFVEVVALGAGGRGTVGSDDGDAGAIEVVVGAVRIRLPGGTPATRVAELVRALQC